MNLDRDPRADLLLYFLDHDRATVRRRANRWEEALVDIGEAEQLIPRLSCQAERRGAVAHARAVMLSEPVNPRSDPARAVVEIGRMREAKDSVLDAAADDLESRIAHRAREWKRATSLSLRAAEALETMGWPSAAATCRRRAAEALLAAGDLDGAEAELSAARSHFDRYGTPLDLAELELAQAKLLSARGAHDEAWDCASKSLAQFDALIRRFTVLSEQQSFLRDKLECYAEAFMVALNAGGDRGCLRAWSVAERSKSFYLCQLLASAEVTLYEGVEPSRLRALAEAGDVLNRLEQQLARLPAGRREGPEGRELVAKLQEASRHKAESSTS